MLIKTVDPSGLLVPSYAGTGDKPLLYTQEAVLYYMMCAPIFTAVDKICTEASSIIPRIYDLEKREFIDKNPVLSLLRYPINNTTYSELMYAMCAWYLITGNDYLIAEGFIGKVPRTLDVYPSQNSVITPDTYGTPQIFQARKYTITETYRKQEVVNYNRARFRYYDSSMPNFRELYHIKTYNPQSSSTMVYGLSPFNALYYDIQQYINGAKHNLSILQRGSRLSGVWSADRALTDDQRNRMEQQINAVMAGATNAGRNVLLDQGGAKFQDVMMTSRDMDYVQMRQKVTEGIYNALDIPLPLISEEHMTLGNLEGSKAIFYESAVIPLVKKIFEELTSFLMPRYDNNNDNLIISFNQNDIPALEPKRNEQAKTKKAIGIFTINELRKEYGLDPLLGGDSIYGTMSDTPIASDPTDPTFGEPLPTSGETKPTAPEPAGEEEAEEPEVTKEAFIATMRKQVNKDGTPRFTVEEINELAQKNFKCN